MEADLSRLTEEMKKSQEAMLCQAKVVEGMTNYCQLIGDTGLLNMIKSEHTSLENKIVALQEENSQLQSIINMAHLGNVKDYIETLKKESQNLQAALLSSQQVLAHENQARQLNEQSLSMIIRQQNEEIQRLNSVLLESQKMAQAQNLEFRQKVLELQQEVINLQMCVLQREQSSQP